MAALRLGPRGPGRGNGNESPLLVSDESGAAFVALDINSPSMLSESEYKMPVEHLIRWRSAQPEDIFVHMFAFLPPADLARVSVVNHAWKHVSYDAGLWRVLDLSNMYTKVDDALLQHLLTSGRFLELEFLSLEGCSAITSKSIAVIAQHSHHLRELRLTDCNQISSRPQELLDLVANAPYLTKLELYRAVDDTSVAVALRGLRPNLDLGMFWYEHCAATGQLLDGSGGAGCRHENVVGADARGCWGRVRGRIIYSNRFYHRGGNFPKEILYSCAAHKDEDLKDSDFHSCEHCDRMFRPPSMWTEMICRTCFDHENLQNKNNWTSLAPAKITAFGFHDIMNRVLRIADRKNIPPTLRHYGTIPCRLDYKLPEEENQSLIIDEHKVPLSIFLENNRDHVSEEIHQAKLILKKARSEMNTRALLVFDAEDNVEILCDKRIILGGRDDEDNLRLTLQAWGQGLNILWPIMIVMAMVVHFVDVFRVQTESHYDGRTSYTYLMYDPAPAAGISLFFALILGGGIILFIAVAVFFFWRYREWCEACFKKFLVADILVIFLFGCGALVWLFAAEIGWPMDAVTFSLATWNLGCIGLISLYWAIPPIIHRFFLIILNAIMAILMIATLPMWLILAFVSLAALADIISELKPQMRLFTAFLIPAHVELMYSTPKILYEVGGLRLRAADLMWYGLMIGIVSTAVSSVTMAFVVVMASIAIIVFVSPFCGKRFRPLPVAFILVILVWAWHDALILPFSHDYSYISFKDPIRLS